MANPTIDEIFAATDIVGLVSEFVGLTKKGKNYVGLCPFHAEKTPSFTVSPEKKLAHCFSCGKGGSPAQFLMDMKHITFPEALRELAKNAGIEYFTPYKSEKAESLAKYYEITNFAKEFYKRNLLKTENGQNALDYLHKRGIDTETIKMFDIGLAPTKMDGLYQVLKEANYLDIDMKMLGLIRTGATGNYDMFMKRIIFPIYDDKSNVVGFSARLYYEDKEQPKYINSTDNIIFNKSEVLYNLDKAKLYISKTNRVVLHEGFMDVFASVKAGIREAVCSMGTALTDGHAKLLRRYTNNVVICYDGDKAGISATIKAILVFERAGMNVHIVSLPNGKDPDDYVRAYGTSSYVDYFNAHMMDPIEFQFQYLTKQYNVQDYNELIEMKERIFTLLAKTESYSSIELYLSRLAETLQVSLTAILQDYDSYYNTTLKQKYVEYPLDNEIVELNNPPIHFSTIPYPDKTISKLLEYAYQTKETCQYLDKMFSQYDLMNFLGNRFTILWYQICDGYYNRYDIFSSDKFQEYIQEDSNALSYYREMKESLAKSEIKKEDEPFSEIDLKECIHSVISANYAYQMTELDKMIQQVSDKKAEYLKKKITIKNKLDTWNNNRNKFIAETK